MHTIMTQTITTESYRASPSVLTDDMLMLESSETGVPPETDTSTRWKVGSFGTLTTIYEEGPTVALGQPDVLVAYDRTALIEAPYPGERERTVMCVDDGADRIFLGEFDSVLEAMEKADSIAREQGWKVGGGQPAPAP